jgi:adenylate kinase
MKLILLGAPGAGKGTQAEIISEKLGIPIIGTGNIIRSHMKRETPLGLKAKSFVEAGGLVPDDLVIGMLGARFAEDDCKNGFILDGFPRTVTQARALDKMGIVIDRVVEIEVSDRRIAARMSGRRVCKDCGSSYHLEYKPPVTEGRCDKCAAELIVRPDDKPETVLERLRVYHDQTEPLKDYYHAAGKLTIVEGQEEVADTTRLTLAALEA